MLASLSAGEKKFIREGLSQNIRYDGRGKFSAGNLIINHLYSPSLSFQVRLIFV
jgi:hypothetical protein